MRIFNVTCPECDCDLDVSIEEADLADTETNHTVVCEDCQTETEYAYDSESDDLVQVDEEDDPLFLGNLEDDEEDKEDEEDEETA